MEKVVWFWFSTTFGWVLKCILELISKECSRNPSRTGDSRYKFRFSWVPVVENTHMWRNKVLSGGDGENGLKAPDGCNVLVIWVLSEWWWPPFSFVTDEKMLFSLIYIKCTSSACFGENKVCYFLHCVSALQVTLLLLCWWSYVICETLYWQIESIQGGVSEVSLKKTPNINHVYVKAGLYSTVWSTKWLIKWMMYIYINSLHTFTVVCTKVSPCVRYLLYNNKYWYSDRRSLNILLYPEDWILIENMIIIKLQ